jgi:hypothetical protein
LSATQPGAIKLDLVFSPERNDNALSNPTWSPGPGYDDVEVECYAQPTAAPRLVPLDSYFNAAMNDTWALAADQSRSEAEAKGYGKTATLGYIHNASSAAAKLAGAYALPTTFKLTFA